MHFQRAESPLKMDCSAAAEAFFKECFRGCDPSQERLFVAHLDGERRCIHLSWHQGDAQSADFPLRQIILDAARHGTASLLLAHNHPSGDTRPSSADCRVTSRLAAAAEAIGCSVLDHFIFGGEGSTSFRRLGLV